MARYESVLQLIGGTPLLHLRRLEEAEGLGGRVYAKLERNNPGRLQRQGPRGPGDAGGGAALSARCARECPSWSPPAATRASAWPWFCAYLGFELLLTMPDSMSKERRDLLAAYGASPACSPPAEKGMQGARGRGKPPGQAAQRLLPLPVRQPGKSRGPSGHGRGDLRGLAGRGGCPGGLRGHGRHPLRLRKGR